MELFNTGIMKKANRLPFKLSGDGNRGMYENDSTGVETLLNRKKNSLIPCDGSSPFQKNVSVPRENPMAEMVFSLRSPLANISLAGEILDTVSLSSEDKMLIDILLRNTARLSNLVRKFSLSAK